MMLSKSLNEKISSQIAKLNSRYYVIESKIEKKQNFTELISDIQSKSNLCQ